MKKKSLLLLLPFVALLTGCTQQVSLQGSADELAQRKVTESETAINFPDDNPSIADGKEIYIKQNCAECHSATGAPAGGKTTVNLSDEKYMWTQKPLDQYQFLTYGKGGGGHPIMKDKLNPREIWSLVFYTRSLGEPPLEKAEWDKVDPVFGSNCAVCHGKKGFGDGPLAHNMEPLPANFHQFNRFYDRDDKMLYDHIANGIDNTQGKPTFAGMPNFLNKVDKAKDVKFDEAYIRKLVAYVRQFHSSLAPTLKETDTTKKQ